LQCKDFLATSNPKNYPSISGVAFDPLTAPQANKNQKILVQKNLKPSIFDKFKPQKKEPETDLPIFFPEHPKNVQFGSTDSRLLLINNIISNISEQICKRSLNKEKLSQAISGLKSLKAQFSSTK